MADKTQNVKTRLSFDGEAEYKAACKEINSTLKVLNSEMKLVTAEYKDNASSVDALKAKQTVLQKTYDEQAKKVKETEAALEKCRKATGDNSEESKKLETQLNYQKAALVKTEQELGKTTDEMEKAEKAADEMGKEIKDSGEQADDAKGKFSGFTSVLSGMGTALKAAAAATAAAVAGAATAIGALTTKAIEGYAAQEQLVGGVETLFKTSSDTVVGYANDAYKTAGMSANEYMETVTSFSASLLASMNNDTAAAAEKANVAITDMSDNANKMGTDISLIQNAYNGFAKQNYTMLDIEMCVRKKNTKSMGATDKDWYFEDATVEAAAELTRYLMNKYGVPASHVIRHYDVTGKICPNPYVYNTSAHTWDEFKRKISGQAETPQGGNEKTIWNFLTGKGLNAYAVAGIMGNLYAESGLMPNNLQNTYNNKLGKTDAEYTAAVDNGSYGNFVKDSAGYGLAQWTYWSRKQALLNHAKQAGVSIADLNMQLGFLWEELQGYTAVMDALKKAGSVRAASDAVLTGYEKPADQSETVKKKRAEYGEGYYKKYAAGNGTKYYRVRKSWTDAASQLGAFTSLENAKSACEAGYTVYDDNGKAVYTAAGQQASAGVPFSVQVDILDLNIRTGAGTNYAKTGETTGKGVFTIVEVKAGQGASVGWGRLKSGAGWISLDYATRLA